MLTNKLPFNIFLFSRPKNVDEVAFQDEVVAVLKKSLEGADVSVMIMSTRYGMFREKLLPVVTKTSLFYSAVIIFTVVLYEQAK